MIELANADNGGPIDYRVTNGIAITVTVVWVLAWVYGAASQEYTMPNQIHGIFFVVVNSIFALQGYNTYRKRNNNNDRK